jgi:hypothetical protein
MRVSSINLVSVFMIFGIDFGNVPTMWYYCFCFISTVQHNVHVLTYICHIFVLNRIDVVMFSFLDSSAIDDGLRAPGG